MFEGFIPKNSEANCTDAIQDNIPNVCCIAWVVSWENNFKKDAIQYKHGENLKIT